MKQIIIIALLALVACSKDLSTETKTVTSNAEVIRHIVPIGSSSTAKWPDSSFYGYPVTKIGIGGASIGNLRAKINWDSLIATNPKQVLFWCGDNDILYKRSYSLMVSDFKWIANKLLKAIPDLNFQLLYIKPTGPNKDVIYTGGYNGWTISEWFNRDMTAWGKANYPNNFNVVDLYMPFLLWNPKRLNTLYYNSDLVHFNQRYGYAKIDSKVRPILLK